MNKLELSLVVSMYSCFHTLSSNQHLITISEIQPYRVLILYDRYLSAIRSYINFTYFFVLVSSFLSQSKHFPPAHLLAPHN